MRRIRGLAMLWNLAPGTTPNARSTPGAPSVLLVEDDPSVRLVLSRALRDGGFAVTPASSGTEALDALRRTLVAAVVLDLGLPDGRGREVLVRLHQLAQKPDQHPVWIIMSALDFSEAARRYGPLGSCFLHKPFNPWDLVTMLQGMIAPDNQQQEQRQ